MSGILINLSFASFALGISGFIEISLYFSTIAIPCYLFSWYFKCSLLAFGISTSRVDHTIEARKAKRKIQVYFTGYHFFTFTIELSSPIANDRNAGSRLHSHLGRAEPLPPERRGPAPRMHGGTKCLSRPTKSRNRPPFPPLQPPPASNQTLYIPFHTAEPSIDRHNLITLFHLSINLLPCSIHNLSDGAAERCAEKVGGHPCKCT